MTVLALVAISTLTPRTAPAAETRSILVLEQEDHGRPAYVEMMEGFRRHIDLRLPGQTAIYAENLDLARFDSAAYRQSMEAWLLTKYRGRNLDAIVAMGVHSIAFSVRFRAEMGRNIPIIFTGAPRAVAAGLQIPRTTGVTLEIDVQGTLDAALKLLPDTQRIVLVSSELSYRGVSEQVHAEVEAFCRTNYLEYIPLIQPPVATTKQRLATLPPRSFVYYFAVNVDSAGQILNPRDVLREISKVSKVPIFSSLDTYFGYGTVGGSTMRFARLGEEVADQVTRALMTDPTDSVPIIKSGANVLRFDWAELTRHGINPSRLPPAIEVLGRPASLWTEHRELMIVTASALVIQTGLLLALIAQRIHRRRAESELRVQRDLLAHASRVSHMGQLASSLAHELSQPLGAILRNAEAAELFLRSPKPDLVELRAIVADIRRDDQRAGDVIERMRGLLKRRALEVTVFSASELVSGVVELIRSDAITRRISIEFTGQPHLPPVVADRIHVKQVLLNLLLNGMDAVQSAARRHVTVRARRAGASLVEVEVSDAGPGIPAENLQRVFEPFFTTKPDGMGLGLAISRSIVEAQGGTLVAENNPDGGATFRFTLPVASADPRA